MTKQIYSTQVELLVLRFRDLGISRGDTIRLHEELISTPSAHVWWGWWNKSGEAIPGAVLRALTERIKENGSIRILLFDSGHLNIRNASCAGIEWNAKHEPMYSPDKSQTPEYYRGRKYLVWFKLTSVGSPISNPSEELRKFSYLRIDEFFSNGRSHYDAFYDKRVWSCDELKQQDRTMWFLRFFRTGDKTHEVTLLHGSQVRPDHFPEEYISSKSQNILWVSDLHFGLNHGFPTNSTPAMKDLGQAIENAAATHGISDFAGVIVSGDITWRAEAAEYAAAIAFFDRLARSPSSLNHYRFAICPGNHDLAFTETPEDKCAAISDRIAPKQARQNYEFMYEKLFYIAPNDYLSMGRRLLIGGHCPVEIVCLNSSLLEQKEGWFQGHGFIGEDQLHTIETTFNWKAGLDNAPRPFRIVVMHHHLLPVVYAEEPRGGTQYSVVLDAERLARWLTRHRVDVLLHGHMHQSFFAKITRPLDIKNPSGQTHCTHVLGLGSTGVNSANRKEVHNMFGVLTAEFNSITVTIYSVFPGNEESRKEWAVTIPRSFSVGGFR